MAALKLCLPAARPAGTKVNSGTLQLFGGANADLFGTTVIAAGGSLVIEDGYKEHPCPDGPVTADVTAPVLTKRSGQLRRTDRGELGA
jgi:hypothetical protein